MNYFVYFYFSVFHYRNQIFLYTILNMFVCLHTSSVSSFYRIFFYIFFFYFLFQSIQAMDEEKNKLDAFCEQSLKNVSELCVVYFINLFLLLFSILYKLSRYFVFIFSSPLCCRV